MGSEMGGVKGDPYNFARNSRMASVDKTHTVDFVISG
jgi:hypothetical protein